MKSKLLLSSAACVLSVAHACAHAQTAPSDEIVVIGTKLSRQKAIEDKKDDSRVIDALGVDELGQLPDKNVGESLNRLPGVSMLVEKGEGRFVQIRGINPGLNNITINGVSLGSPEAEGGGRGAPLDVISGSVLGGVQVIKTPTPDMDAQGIGGTVNVDTAMPFDRDDLFYGYATGRYGYEEIRPKDGGFGGHDPYALDALLSGKFADGALGWLVGASWSDREYVAQGRYQDDWAETFGIGLPVNVKNNYYIIGRERLNLNAAIEWRPDEDTQLFVRGFFADWNEFQHRNRFEENFDTDVVVLTDRSGASGENRVNANIRLEQADKELLTLAAGGEKTVGRYTLSFLGQRSENELSEPNDFWEFRSGSIFGPNAWALNEFNIVDITPDAGSPDRQDPSLIDFRRVRFFDRALEEVTWTGKVDLRYDIDETAYLKSGVKYASTERVLDESRRRFNPGASALTLGTSPAFTDGAFINDTDAGDAPNIFMNIDGLNAFFNDPANASFFEPDPDDDFVADNAADYALRERIIAGYAMGAKQLGRLELIAGARVEWTDIDSSANLLSNGVATRIEDGGDYVTVTPSVIANYRPDDSFVFRAAVTRALGRPDFDVIAPRATASDDGGPIASVNIGNPDLRPRTSWNFDLSGEWYPNEFTALAVGLFYKDISDELVPFTQSLTTQADMDAALAARGLTGSVDTSALTRLDLTTTINGASAVLKGVELLGQTQFDFLPSPFDGLGVSASATFIDGETELPDGQTLPLVGQAETTYAVSIFYQKGPIDASVSYAYNDSFLTDPNADPDLALDQGSFGRWDAKLTYNVRRNVKLFVEGVNLNNEPTTEFQGGRKEWNTEHEYVGTTFFFGASVGF
ncbi:MAG: TonB-dependent receptor [Amphiplicatus sp.]